jgi:hypothetical protein
MFGRKETGFNLSASVKALVTFKVFPFYFQFAAWSASAHSLVVMLPQEILQGVSS